MTNLTRVGSQLRRALSQIEVIVASIFVSLVVVAALHSFGVVLNSREATGSKAQAEMLAHALMNEILATDYEDEVLPIFGREVNELLGTSRANFDDVDDYHNWTTSPPQAKDGNVLPNCSGLRRSVTVVYVSRQNPSQIVLLDQGIKRVTVTVSRSGIELAASTALRTREYSDP